MIVSVFGGASPSVGDPAYQEAYLLGALLARHGDIVMNGGYIGTMEAVSRGAAEAGGHVIGVTCVEIENWRPIKPNAWVVEEHKHQTLSDRLQELMMACDAAVALPGGVGTLAEITMLWNQLIIQARPPCPLILVGKDWETIFSTFINSQRSYLSQSMIDQITFADRVEKAVTILHPNSKSRVTGE